MSWLDRALDALPAQRRALEALAHALTANLQDALGAFAVPGIGQEDRQAAAEGVFGALAQGRSAAETLGATAALRALALDRISVLPQTTSGRFYRAVEGTVDRNLADLVADPSPETLRRIRHRLRLAAGVLVRHYYWESQRKVFQAAAKTTKVQVRYMWVANIVAGNPCPTCLALHGQQVGQGEEFPHGPPGSPKVFLALTSPPRHPNCQCSLVPYVVNLETVSTEVPVRPSEVVQAVRVPTEGEDFYSSGEIRRLPAGVFASILAALGAVISWFGRRLG